MKCHQDTGWVTCSSTCLKGHLPPLSQGHQLSKMPHHGLPQLTLAWQQLSDTDIAPCAGGKCPCPCLALSIQLLSSAEPGGDLKETTFLPLLRNPERYQSTPPTFPFPKGRLSNNSDQSSSGTTLTLWLQDVLNKNAGSPAQRGKVSFLLLSQYWCWMGSGLT